MELRILATDRPDKTSPSIEINGRDGVKFGTPSRITRRTQQTVAVFQAR